MPPHRPEAAVANVTGTLRVGGPAPGPRRGLSVGGRLGLAALCGLFASVLAALAVASPWWYLTTSSAGLSSTVAFYPGPDLRITTVGGGGAESYAAAGVPGVGSLYEGILAGTVALALLGLVVLVLLLILARRRTAAPWADRAVPRLLVAALVLGIFMAALVPIAQPQLYRAANPGASCSSPTPVPACQGFWGSSTHGGSSSAWGAGPGWWLDVVATLGLLLTVLVKPGKVAAVPDPARRPSSAPLPKR